MKKITLFLFFAIIALGYAKAELPEGDDLYYIQVLGTDAIRYDRVITVGTGVEGIERAFSQPISSTSFDEVYGQLWQFEDLGPDEEGINEWLIRSKLRGTYLNPVEITTGTNDAKKWVAGLADFEQVESGWRLEESSRPGYYLIISKEQVKESRESNLHMGNNGWKLAVVFESGTSEWGTGGDSQFQFVKYEDPGLTVSADTLDYKYVMENDFSKLDLNVLGYSSLTADIEYEIEGADVDAFSVERGEWNPRTGGILSIYYDAAEPRAYKATLKVWSGDILHEIALLATSVTEAPVQYSPSVAPSTSDVWYGILFDKRTGYYLTDMGENQLFDAQPVTKKNDDAQLWKFVQEGQTFTLVNKLGRQLEYKPGDPNPETGDATVGKFISVPAYDSGNTYTFEVRNSDGYFQILWNEFQGKEEYGANINKLASIGFGPLKNASNLGNAIKFVPAAEMEITTFPVLSTSANPTWYYLQFARPLTPGAKGGQKPNNAVQSPGMDGEAVTLIQSAIDEQKANTAFYWRFEGTWNNFKMVDYNGNEIFRPEPTELDDNGNLIQPLVEITTSGLGSNFSFVKFEGGSNWELNNIDLAEDVTIRYFNDFNGDGLQVGFWTLGDPGNQLIITPIADYVWTGMNNPFEDVNDPIIDRDYYTIQGTYVGKAPQADGLYIVKQTHSSKKVSAQKEFYRNK